MVSQHLTLGITDVLVRACIKVIFNNLVNPVQVTPSIIGNKFKNTLCVTVRWVHHTGGRLCSQVDLLCCSECAPNFCLGGNVNGFCLSYPLHLQSWPELAFLMKKYLKSLCVIFGISLIDKT